MGQLQSGCDFPFPTLWGACIFIIVKSEWVDQSDSTLFEVFDVSCCHCESTGSGYGGNLRIQVGQRAANLSSKPFNLAIYTCSCNIEAQNTGFKGSRYELPKSVLEQLPAPACWHNMKLIGDFRYGDRGHVK